MPSIGSITSAGSGLPNRYVILAPEKVGKTSFAAQTPNPVFLMTCGETGLETLIDAGRIKETPHFPEVSDWSAMIKYLELLQSEEHGYRTLVIDTLNGAERMCHEHVCIRDFKSDWGERGFSGYQRGYEISLAEWRKLLILLDQLRTTRKMSVVCLSHIRVATFNNPEGANYDRYTPEMHHKTWGLTHKWADAILFINTETFVDEANPAKKGKATSTATRIMYTEKHAAYDAGNRLGLPPEIELGTSPEEAWTAFCSALKSTRKE